MVGTVPVVASVVVPVMGTEEVARWCMIN